MCLYVCVCLCVSLSVCLYVTYSVSAEGKWKLWIVITGFPFSLFFSLSLPFSFLILEKFFISVAFPSVVAEG